MKNFFDLKASTSNLQISPVEKFLPLLILCILILLIISYRNHIKNNGYLDRTIRYAMGIVSLIFLTIYYYLEWTTFGINPHNLPLHLCFISSILCSIICFKFSKVVYNFVFYAGILGGASSLLFPAIDLSSHYFRYYEFMIIHSLIILVPVYYAMVYELLPNFKETIFTIFVLELISIPLGLFNEYFDTTYMFVSFTSNSAARDSILYYIGEGHIYFIKLQAITISTIMIFYTIIKILLYTVSSSQYFPQNANKHM